MIHRKEGWLLFMVWNSLPDSILHHASCSGLRISRELSLRPFRTLLRPRYDVSRNASSAVKTSHLVKRLSRLSSPMRVSHAPICTSLKFLRPRLRLRGGSDQSLQEYGIERPKMQTYYDVDGTVFFLLPAAFWGNINFL